MSGLDLVAAELTKICVEQINRHENKYLSRSEVIALYTACRQELIGIKDHNGSGLAGPVKATDA